MSGGCESVRFLCSRWPAGGFHISLTNKNILPEKDSPLTAAVAAKSHPTIITSYKFQEN